MYFGKIESPKEKRKQAPGILGALLRTVFIGRICVIDIRVISGLCRSKNGPNPHVRGMNSCRYRFVKTSLYKGEEPKLIEDGGLPPKILHGLDFLGVTRGIEQ